MLIMFCTVIDKTGIIKDDAFFTILNLHGMNLTESEKAKLKRKHSKANKINFKEALQSINIDLDSAILNEQKWTVQDGGVGKLSKAENSLVAGKQITHLSRMSLEEFK